MIAHLQGLQGGGGVEGGAAFLCRALGYLAWKAEHALLFPLRGSQ